MAEAANGKEQRTKVHEDLKVLSFLSALETSSPR